jgi:DNA-binding transcriptional ArsR family regulator
MAARHPNMNATLRETETLLHALAEPRRLAILRLVHSRELAAGEISRHFSTTRPAISQHLRVLTDAGLLTQRRDGTRRLYRVRPEAFQRLRSFLDFFWEDKLAQLKAAAEGAAGSKRGR